MIYWLMLTNGDLEGKGVKFDKFKCRRLHHKPAVTICNLEAHSESGSKRGKPKVTHVEMQCRRDAAETGTNYRAPTVLHNLLLSFLVE